MPAPKKQALSSGAEHEYQCLRCGSKVPTPEKMFYKARWSDQYAANDGYCPLCRSCVDDLFDTFSRRYRSDHTACILICHMLDMPFYNVLFDSVVEKNSSFSMGLYLRTLNGRQYNNKSFCTTITEGELSKSEREVKDELEEHWTPEEKQNYLDTLEVVGYDPFEAFKVSDRRFLFSELVKYFDDDVAEDQYKLSQIIQIVINNNQVRQCDLLISQLDPCKDVKQIGELADLKATITNGSNAIAKENEISVKNRSNKAVGKSTLTYLMRDMREKNLPEIATNFYEMLSSPGTQWAANASIQGIKQNAMFDENDVMDIIDTQREMIRKLQAANDRLLEENRLLTLERIQASEIPDGDGS